MSLAEKLQEAEAIAARLNAGAAVPKPFQQMQRTGSAAPAVTVPAFGSGAISNATSGGAASQPVATPGAQQQPAAVCEAVLAVRNSTAAPAPAAAAAAASSRGSRSSSSSI